MQLLTHEIRKRVCSRHRHRANLREPWGRALEVLEARTLLSISPMTIDSGQTLFAATALTTNEILDPTPFVWTYVNSPEPHYVGVTGIRRSHL